MDSNHIQKFESAKVLQEIDIQFAELMVRLSGNSPTDSLFSASLLLNHTTARNRHICLDLKTAANRRLVDFFPDYRESTVSGFSDIKTPPLQIWLDELKQSSVVGKPGEYCPLVLDENNRLYLYRYWEYEQKLAGIIRQRLAKTTPPPQLLKLQNSFDSLFSLSKTSPDWQKIAAFMAVRNRFCVISGGPGTGKTYTIALILALLLELNPDYKIVLAAPTGKAAARLQDSLNNAKRNLVINRTLSDRIPASASTIHRLLGVRPGSSQFSHHEKNPLIADLFIIDEASMVSLALMSKLLQAIPIESRVILLGDKNQLSSVESGAVFGDISEAGDIDGFSGKFIEDFQAVTGETIRIGNGNSGDSAMTALSDSIVELKHSYRFETSPGIGALSRMVKEGNTENALTSLNSAILENIIHNPLPGSESLKQRLNNIVEKYLLQSFKAKSVEESFSCHNRFKVLCSHRMGDYGVTGINQQIEQLLIQQKVIDFETSFYKGKPIIIKQNDYNLGLYNGDTGIIWDDESGTLKAFFPGINNQFKSFSLARLPLHKSVYAMTIHESQGSEFDEILIVLPNVTSPIFTRELLYTAITRAKRSVEIWANDETLKIAIAAKTYRQSGLQDALISP
ncbi:exodeoxyribonuclease V subunit alpha [bacterium]|nr:exodeoxyribonuclease V subunit alpha [bacterium]